MRLWKMVCAVTYALLLLVVTAGCGESVGPQTSGSPPHVVTVAGQNPTLGASFFLNSTDGWAAGTFMDKSGLTSNFLVRTTNGGASWTEFSTASIQIYALQFVSPEVGFALASEGEQPAALWRSTNGGASWRMAYSFPAASSPSAIMALHFPSPAWGFASLGASVVFITGEGTHFKQYRLTGPAQPLLTVFQDPSHGIAVGSQSIWTVTAGAPSASAVNLVAHRTYRLPRATAAFALGRGYGSAVVAASVAFWGTSRVWVALQLNRCSAAGCPSLLLRSTNAGGSWQVVSQTGAPLTSGIPGLAAPGVRDMATASLSATGPNGLVGTSAGQFLVASSDAGNTWGLLSTVPFGLIADGGIVPVGTDRFIVTTYDEILLVGQGSRVSELLLKVQARGASGSP
ncbi:MAG: hypothetical protein ACYCO4_00660 [Sulfobacillus sp.]